MNGYIAQFQNVSVKNVSGYTSLISRLSCAGGEPRNNGTVSHDQLITQNTNKLI